MNATFCRTAEVGRLSRGAALGLFLVGIPWGVSSASPPAIPLPPPYYSFDLASPSVIDGTVAADAMLEVNAGAPRIVVQGGAIGLGRLGDDLSSLSMNTSIPAPTDTMVLLFSVDRATVGVGDPEPALVALQVPFNVKDQASKGQAAGDQFMTTTLFTLAGGAVNAGRAPLLNNVLIRNNYDEGGTDFGGEPPTSAKEDGGGAPQDDTDATSESPPASRGPGIVNVFFTASADSPSLTFLPGVTPSGATVFFNPDPINAMIETTVFANFSDLGLQSGDDINAMIVFDTGFVGQYDALDRIIFSLTPNSPSLAMIPGTTPDGGAADLFTVSMGGPPAVFASAAELGLGTAADNVDALGYLLCPDAQQCAADHGIRDGVVPTASSWGLAILALLTLAAGVVIIRRQSHRRLA